MPGSIGSHEQWYVADLIVEITVETASENIVHINTLLLRATSPEAAFESALELGREHESSYVNPEGQTVKTVFRGLADLNAIDAPLDQDMEFSFAQQVGVSEHELQQLITPKEQLSVFRSDDEPSSPISSSVRLSRVTGRLATKHKKEP